MLWLNLMSFSGWFSHFKLFYNLPHLCVNPLYFRLFCLWHSCEFPNYYKLFNCSQRTSYTLLFKASYQMENFFPSVNFENTMIYYYWLECPINRLISKFQVFHFLGLLKLHLLWKMSPICNLSYEFQVSFLKTAVKFIRSIAWASQWADLLTLTSFVSNNKVCLKVYFVQY